MRPSRRSAVDRHRPDGQRVEVQVEARQVLRRPGLDPRHAASARPSPGRTPGPGRSAGRRSRRRRRAGSMGRPIREPPACRPAARRRQSPSSHTSKTRARQAPRRGDYRFDLPPQVNDGQTSARGAGSALDLEHHRRAVAAAAERPEQPALAQLLRPDGTTRLGQARFGHSAQCSAISSTFSAFISPERERLNEPRKTTSSATVTFACM